jgi:hypothetical protein
MMQLDLFLLLPYLFSEPVSECELLSLLPHEPDGPELEVHPVPQPVQLVLLHLSPPTEHIVMYKTISNNTSIAFPK